MGHWKGVLKKLLFPGRGCVVLAVLLGGVSLTLTFLVFGEGSPFAYISYLISAYALTVLIAAAMSVFSAVEKLLHQFTFTHRYLTDKHFAVWCGLALSSLINLGFAVLKLFYAILYSSFGDGALAIYNILLCVVRVYLLRSFPMGRNRQKFEAELRRYRLTGVFLFFLDAALAMISSLIVIKGNGYYYPGTLIYAMAFHAFYALTLAITNTVRYRKLNSPILSAAKAVNLTTALVSMFSLETAMLTQFGPERIYFRLVMTSATAFVVCSAVFAIAIFMVISANRKLRRLFK